MANPRSKTLDNCSTLLEIIGRGPCRLYGMFQSGRGCRMGSLGVVRPPGNPQSAASSPFALDARIIYLSDTSGRDRINVGIRTITQVHAVRGRIITGTGR